MLLRIDDSEAFDSLMGFMSNNGIEFSVIFMEGREFIRIPDFNDASLVSQEFHNVTSKNYSD